MTIDADDDDEEEEMKNGVGRRSLGPPGRQGVGWELGTLGNGDVIV